jgi:hypothetical protein
MKEKHFDRSLETYMRLGHIWQENSKVHLEESHQDYAGSNTLQWSAFEMSVIASGSISWVVQIPDQLDG